MSSSSTHRGTSTALNYARAPEVTATRERTWITRASNFVVTVSEVEPGAVLERQGQPDEYFVYVAAPGQARIHWGGQALEVGPESLTIVPPGASRVEVLGGGKLVRQFTNRNVDLLAQAGNAADFETPQPNVAPLPASTPPKAGHALRSFKLDEHVVAGSSMRLFRTADLMFNAILPKMQARDTHKLTPHSHADFEQASLALTGEWIHHLRYPWTPDMSSWREDEHPQMGSPSIVVIPPTVVHTSRNIGDGHAQLIDLFAPPRQDFLSKGMVHNASDYE
jgi:mannose-6-phosphate isomerase-like protein (cupin superfamily)